MEDVMLVATIAIILVTRVAKLVIAIIAFNMVLAAMVIVANYCPWAASRVQRRSLPVQKFPGF